jgi:hypothetical protein
MDVSSFLESVDVIEFLRQSHVEDFINRAKQNLCTYSSDENVMVKLSTWPSNWQGWCIQTSVLILLKEDLNLVLFLLRFI